MRKQTHRLTAQNWWTAFPQLPLLHTMADAGARKQQQVGGWGPSRELKNRKIAWAEGWVSFPPPDRRCVLPLEPTLFSLQPVLLASGHGFIMLAHAFGIKLPFLELMLGFWVNENIRW
jgi:hypothetical protein